MAGTNISTVDMWNYVRAAAAVTPQEIARERKAQEISSDPQPEACAFCKRSDPSVFFLHAVCLLGTLLCMFSVYLQTLFQVCV